LRFWRVIEPDKCAIGVRRVVVEAVGTVWSNRGSLILEQSGSGKVAIASALRVESSRQNGKAGATGN
jgi:hypothetical protein